MLPRWPLRLYYDGDCPLCAREIALLRRRSSEQRLVLIDISSPAFDPTSTPFETKQLQAVLHAQDAEGTWLKGLDATYASWLAADLEDSPTDDGSLAELAHAEVDTGGVTHGRTP